MRTLGLDAGALAIAEGAADSALGIEAAKEKLADRSGIAIREALRRDMEEDMIIYSERRTCVLVLVIWQFHYVKRYKQTLVQVALRTATPSQAHD